MESHRQDSASTGPDHVNGCVVTAADAPAAQPGGAMKRVSLGYMCIYIIYLYIIILYIYIYIYNICTGVSCIFSKQLARCAHVICIYIYRRIDSEYL